MQKKLEIKDRTYRLTRGKAPLSYTLQTRNTRKSPLMYYDEEKNINRALRYSRNQKSPFEDEQDGNAILEPVVFIDGMLTVPKTNPVLQRFLSLHPANGIKFKEVDAEKDAQVEVDRMNDEAEAFIKAKELPLEMLENTGRVLFGSAASRMTTSELKRDIMVYAKNNPKDFLAVMNDPQFTLNAKIQRFFDAKLLTFRKNNQEVWYNTSSNKTRMLVVPYGENPLYLVASYLSSDDGVESLKMLEGLME